MASGLSFDDGRTVQASRCDECGIGHKLVKQFVLEDGNAHAVLFVALHGHRANEAWVDAILGSPEPSPHQSPANGQSSISGEA